jgi:hypothetical protein
MALSSTALYRQGLVTVTATVTAINIHATASTVKNTVAMVPTVDTAITTSTPTKTKNHNTCHKSLRFKT